MASKGHRAGDNQCADLVGVNYQVTDQAVGDLARVVDRLIDQGVRFRSETPEIPWLVAAEPYPIGPRLQARLDSLGTAIFIYFDALQALYREGEPTVRSELDGMTPTWLCGLDLDKAIEMFRLDILVADGEPKITEVEEIFGSAGKAVAMAHAYGLAPPSLVEFLAERRIDHIFVCDDYPEYLAEVGIVARHVAIARGAAVQTVLGSAFDAATAAVAWRFAAVSELARYGVGFLEDLCRSGVALVNPLFHGFGTKAALTLIHDSRLGGALEAKLDPSVLVLLRKAIPTTLSMASPTVDIEEVLRRRRHLLLKVIECPTQPLLTWGSRGVFFGERSQREWELRVAQGLRGQVAASDGTVQRARIVVSELVDSDRVDVRFLHPTRARVCQMARARCRLGPIYVRWHERAIFAGGHATFVNTSRKVHLGRHAVCAPLVPAGDGRLQHG